MVSEQIFSPCDGCAPIVTECCGQIYTEKRTVTQQIVVSQPELDEIRRALSTIQQLLNNPGTPPGVLQEIKGLKNSIIPSP